MTERHVAVWSSNTSDVTVPVRTFHVQVQVELDNYCIMVYVSFHLSTCVQKMNE